MVVGVGGGGLVGCTVGRGVSGAADRSRALISTPATIATPIKATSASRGLIRMRRFRPTGRKLASPSDAGVASALGASFGGPGATTDGRESGGGGTATVLG